MTLKTPYYLIDETLLVKNLQQLKEIEQKAGCKILLAQKAFSMFSLYPLIGEYLSGTTASGLYEARLGKEEMGKENHVFATAYRPEELEEITTLCDHIIFNSISQLERYQEYVKRKGKQIGIRINPECSTQDNAIYDPCSEGSRLGITASQLENYQLEGVSGMHFHTLCEQGCDALKQTLQAVEERFGAWLPTMKWVNFGGGHHITKADYDREELCSVIRNFRQKYQVEVYLEPGEAVALDAGVLVSTVLDITENRGKNIILDTSAACHMPDVLEMPYRPSVVGAGLPYEKRYEYRIGGPTCLAGDVIGSYSFDQEVKIGDEIVFCDMAIYSMVKNNTFNGMKLPDIAVLNQKGEICLVKEFGYHDFKQRLS